jgi:hypothetical protein
VTDPEVQDHALKTLRPYRRVSALPHDSSEAVTAQPSPPDEPHGRRKRKRPNVLILIFDQMRLPSVYKSETTREWRLENLGLQSRLRAHGLDFQHHDILSSVCVPTLGNYFRAAGYLTF